MTSSINTRLNAAAKGVETDDMFWAQLREASAAQYKGAFLRSPASVIPDPGFVLETVVEGRRIRLLDTQKVLTDYLHTAKVSPQVAGPILHSLSHLDIIAGAKDNGQVDPSQKPDMQVLKPYANNGLLLDQAGLNTYLGQMIPDLSSADGRKQAGAFTLHMTHTLEMLLLLSVDDPAQWGKFMPSAAFQVFPAPQKEGEPRQLQRQQPQAPQAQAVTATNADQDYARGVQAGRHQAKQEHQTPWLGLGALGLGAGALGWIIGRRNALAEIEVSDGVVVVKTKPQSDTSVGSKWSRMFTGWMSDPNRSEPGVPLVHAAAPNLSPKSRFGNNRFIILEKIGEGDTSVVYKAKDQNTGDLVALKVFKRTGEPLIAERLETEVKCIRSLKHDGVVRIVSHGKDKATGLLYLAMHYVKGKPLSTFLKDMKAKGPVPAALVIEIGIQLLQALREAHRNGIWQRDLKPSNIMINVSPEGDEVNLKVIIFGLAKISTNIDFAIDRVLLGTPDYIAPEQIKGKPSERSDLYAVGVILFELFSGRLPFGGTNFIEVLGKVMTHVYEPLKPSKEAHPAEADLIDLIHSALENKEGNRPQNATAFLARLKAIQLDYQTPLLIPEDERPTLRLQQRPTGIPGIPDDLPAPSLLVGGTGRTLPFGTPAPVLDRPGDTKATGRNMMMAGSRVMPAASQAKVAIAAQQSTAALMLHQRQTQVRLQSGFPFLGKGLLARPGSAFLQPRGLFIPRGGSFLMR